MNHSWKAFLHVVLIASFSFSTRAWAVDEPKQIELCDYVGRAWTHELVGFPVEGDPKMIVVRDEQGQEIPCQPGCPLLETTTQPWKDWFRRLDAKEQGETDGRIFFLTDLPANGTRRFDIVPGQAQGSGGKPASVPASVTVQEDGEDLVIDAQAVAVRMPGRRAAGSSAAPLLAVRGVKGIWYGRGQLADGMNVVRQETRVLAAGPVFALIACRYELAGGGRYDVLVQLIAGEPVVNITEHVEGEKAVGGFQVILEGNVVPQWYAWRSFDRIPPPKTVAVRYLDPVGSVNFLYWQDRIDYENGSKFATIPYHSWSHDISPWWAGILDNGDAWGIAPVHAGRWLPNGTANLVEVACERGPRCRVLADMVPGNRQWLLVAGTADAMAAKLGTPEPCLAEANLCMRMQTKYGALELDRVKDWVLAWPETTQHPCTLIRPDQVPEVRHRASQWKEFAEVLAAHRDEPPDPVEFEKTGIRAKDHAGLYLLTGDESLALAGAADVDAIITRHLDRLFKTCPGHALNVTLNQWHPSVKAMAWDFVASSRSIPPQQRQAIRAKLAFWAYWLAGEDIWPPKETGIGTGNENFETAYLSALARVAAMLSDHPQAASWLRHIERFIDFELAMGTWPGGAWMESPNYQAAPMMSFIQLVVALANNGGRNFIHDPRLKSSIDFLARIQTPPDPRQGRAMLPTVGDTSAVSGSQGTQVIFAWMANLCRDDPDFSKRMMFAWRRAGAPVFGLITWTNWYTPACLIDPTLPAAPPAAPLVSERLPGYGAILRTAWNTDHETYFLMKCGQCRAHYDPDEGSFHLYALGVPLALDYACQYIPPNVQPWFHNRLSFERIQDGEPGTIQEFDSLADVDYLVAEHYATYGGAAPEVPGAPDPPRHDYQRGIQPCVNHRRVLFIKGDSQPYFLIGDQPNAPYPTEASYHVLAKEVKLGEHDAHFTGQLGVDLDLFVALPQKPVLTHGEWGYRHDPQCTPPWSVLPVEREPWEERQVYVRVGAGPNQENLALLWPRRHDQPPPECQPLKDGAGFDITYGDRHDTVFCSSRPLVATDFVGRVGYRRLSPSEQQIAMIRGSRIAVPGLAVHGEGPYTVRLTANRLSGECDGPTRRLIFYGSAVPWEKAALTLDGQPARLIEMYRGPRAIDLPEGKHRFEVTW